MIKTVFFCCFILAVFLFVADIVFGTKHCNAGFEGYPDVWTSIRAEKIHYALSISYIFWLFCSIVLLFFIV